MSTHFPDPTPGAVVRPEFTAAQAHLLLDVVNAVGAMLSEDIGRASDADTGFTRALRIAEFLMVKGIADRLSHAMLTAPGTAAPMPEGVKPC
jgi:hypothetical protein